MSHLSEYTRRLTCEKHVPYSIKGLERFTADDPQVILLKLPLEYYDSTSSITRELYKELDAFCDNLNKNTTLCILTTPIDAVEIFKNLERTLKFQLWIAVKTSICSNLTNNLQLQKQHLSLLVLTRYHGSLKHTKTRIQYSYCPACGKTTKDYGGKKHVYHEYGTLMSDVWRDVEYNPDLQEHVIEDRLQDLFGLELYSKLEVIDLSKCVEFKFSPSKFVVKDALKNEQIYIFETIDNPNQTETRLINSDCIEAMRSIKTDSIDFCFADPPYNLEKKYDGYNDSIELRDYFYWCDNWLAELARVLKPGRTCAVLNIPLWTIRHFQHLAKTLNFQAWIVWEAMGLPVRMIMPSHYSILCFSKGEPRPLPGLFTGGKSDLEQISLSPTAENFCNRSSCIAYRKTNLIPYNNQLTDLWFDIHRLKHNSRRVDHPCQLPPQLMRRLISLYTIKNEVVLDCFNGVGTTTLCAHQLERGYIGIEVSEQYHNIATQRHKELRHGIDPFRKNESVPQSKNSRVRRLPKQKYKISKKILQLDVRRIAHQIGKLPTRQDVMVLSKYPIEYFDDYFISWGEVCAAARTTGMSELPINSRESALSLPLIDQDNES